MAQYDVYANPNPRSRESVPYVVDVQSGLVQARPTRFVMPLSRVGVRSDDIPRRLVPVYVVKGERLALHPHEAAGIDARLLRRPLTSLDSAFSPLRGRLAG